MTQLQATRPALAPHDRPTAAVYVVSVHKVRDRDARGPQDWLPYGMQHAWRPGTRSTLCGQSVSNWTVFWERSFTARAEQVCPDCVEATLPAASRARLAPRLAG